MVATERAVELAKAAAVAADEKKGESILALDVSAHMPLADIFLIASGTNERHVSSIVDGIEERLHAEGAKALHREGIRAGRWAVLDFNDVIVHVMHQEDRAYYELERLWKDCPVVPLPEFAPPVAD